MEISPFCFACQMPYLASHSIVWRGLIPSKAGLGLWHSQSLLQGSPFRVFPATCGRCRSLCAQDAVSFGYSFLYLCPGVTAAVKLLQKAEGRENTQPEEFLLHVGPPALVLLMPLTGRAGEGQAYRTQQWLQNLQDEHLLLHVSQVPCWDLSVLCWLTTGITAL